MKKTLLLACLLLFVCLVHAQTRITGTVTEQDGKTPVPFVTVSVKGQTSAVATTDIKGKYSINVPASAKTLVFSFVGMKTEEVDIGGRNLIDILLSTDSEQLDEAVITAEFGIKRPARAMGAAVQSIKGADLAESMQDNFTSALQGRVAGLQVTQTGGSPGSSTSVLIRGATSISGNNQPLYIIDGMPMDNSSFNASSTLATNTPTATATVTDASMDFASRGNEINPNDIESITVLKGAAAAALYGSDASNGAIIITTKKGRSGRARVSYSNSFRFDQAYRYPEMQTKYDNGSYGTTNYYNRKLWGQERPAGMPLYNNIKNLFEVGLTQRHNLSIDAGNESMTVRASAGYSGQSGNVVNTDYTRINLGLAGTAKVNAWLNMESSLQYINTTNTKAPKGTDGVLDRTFSWPLADDMRVYLTPDGRMRFPDYYADTDILNPYFGLYKNKNYDVSDRFLASYALNISPIKDWVIRGQVGVDVGFTTYEISRHPDYSTNRDGKGTYDLSDNTILNPTMQVISSYRKQFGKFNASIQLGYHQNEQKRSSLSVHGEGFMVRDFQSIQNCKQESFRDKTVHSTRRVQAVSGQMELSYNNLMFLTIKGRNDWTSTLPIDNNSFFYPGADLSIIASELFKKSDVLSYLKLRTSIAQVGKDASPLSVYPALEVSTATGGGYRYGYTGPNLKLKPEINTAWEVGAEARFFKNRLNLDVAYYSTHSEDQIINGFRMSYATGFILNNMNIGSFRTSGVELMLSGDLIKKKDWTVNIGLNMNKNWSKVLSLPENLPEYYNSGTWLVGNIRNGIMVGHPITSLTCIPIQRNDAGQRLIDQTTGLPLIASDWTVCADREPELKYGVTIGARWKNLSFSTLLDGRVGATVVNGTMYNMMIDGQSWESVDWREKQGVVFSGVLKDGSENTATPTPNNITVNIAGLSAGYYGSNEDWIERDIQYLRIAEMRLAYGVPTKWLQNATKNLLSSASVFIAVNDLATFTNYSGIDVVGNSNSASLGGTGGVGIDLNSVAIPRGYSFGLNLSF